MFPRNGTVRDWEFRAELDQAIKTISGAWGQTATGAIVITPQWGVDFDVASYGFRVDVRDTYDAAGVPAFTLTVTIKSGSYSFTTASWADIARVRLIVRDFGLTADCDTGNWSVAYGDVEVHLDTVLKHTFAGPFNYSGTGYSERLNGLEWDAIASVTPGATGIGSGCPVLVADLPTTFVKNVEVDAWIGWRWDSGGGWQTDEIFNDCAMAPQDVDNDCTGVDCECVQGLAAYRDSDGVSPQCPTDSWEVYVQERFIWESSSTLAEHFIRPCTPCIGGNEEYDGYDVIENQVTQPGDGFLLRKAQGVLATHRVRQAWCDCVYPFLSGPDVLTTDIDEPYTYCGLHRGVLYLHREARCWYMTAGPCICAFPDEPDVDAPVNSETICCYYGDVALTHPTEPTCVGRILAYDVSDSQRHARIGVDASGFLVTQLSSNTNALSWTTKTSTITADWACVRWTAIGSKQALVLWTEETGAIKQRISYNEGSSWSVATTIEAGPGNTKPAGLIGKDRKRFIYWIDGTEIHGQIRDAADNTLHATFTAYAGPVDNDAISVDERVTSGGKRQLVLQCIVSGAVTELYSTDGQTFA